MENVVFSGYADDVWTVSKFTQKSHNSIPGTFDHFALTTGLKVNYDKTLVLWIGLMEKVYHLDWWTSKTFGCLDIHRHTESNEDEFWCNFWETLSCHKGSVT